MCRTLETMAKPALLVVVLTIIATANAEQTNRNVMHQTAAVQKQLSNSGNVLHPQVLEKKPVARRKWSAESRLPTRVLSEGNKRDETELVSATERQLDDMCRRTGCQFSDYYRSVTVYDMPDVIPKILQHLKQNNLNLEGWKFSMNKADDKPKLERIIHSGEENEKVYTLEFSGSQQLELNEEHIKYITGGVTELLFQEQTEVERIDDGFFETFFPNLVKIRISRSGPLTNHRNSKRLSKLQIGFLPKLTLFYVDTLINGNLSACVLPLGETACYADGVSFYIFGASRGNPLRMELVDFHLPENVEKFEFSLGKTIFSGTDIFEGQSINEVNFNIMSTEQLAGISFKNAIVKEKFIIQGGRIDDAKNFPRNLDSILHNPTIARVWNMYYSRTEALPVPVVFGTSEEQPFEDMKGNDLESEPCSFAKHVTDYGNEFSGEVERKSDSDPSSTKKVVTVRGLYIDMTDLVDRLRHESRRFDELEVTAFHVHVSASRNVSYPLRVSYMKVTSHNDASINNLVPVGEHRRVVSIGSSGTQLKLRDGVDAIFTQAFKACTAILIAQERNLGTVGNSIQSSGNQMWSYKLPATLRGSNIEIAKAQQMVIRVGEFMEYLKEAASQRAMRVPYLSLQYQQENMAILLNMAESIEDEKKHDALISKIEDATVEILNHQDKSTLTLLHTEYKRTVSLVLISTRRAHDIDKKLKATIELVTEVSAKFDAFKEEMETANATFQAGVRRAQAFAYAEVAAAVTSSVISFFTGGFDPGKIARAAKKMKDMMFKIKKLMNLRTIFAKLANLIKILRNIQELSKRATASMSGRVGRLFEKIKNFRIKRKTHLTRLLEQSGSFPIKGPLLMKKQIENQKFIDKYTKIFKQIKTGRESVDYLNTAMQGIVDAEKAKVTLANAFTEGEVQDVHHTTGQGTQTVTEEVIDEALHNEFSIATGDRAEQLEEFKQILKEYELTKSKGVIEEGEKLNAADVLEWDAASANVEGTMDASISMDIPETTSFKAALLKMNLAGKLKTQAMIDEAAIRVDLDRARFETTTYFKEGAAILNKIKEIEEGIKKRKEGEDIEAEDYKNKYRQKRKEEQLRLKWKEFNVKFNILVDSMSYCSAYYYFHLSACPPEHSFDFDTSLPNIVHQQRELQRQSLLQLEDFYPPPQTMENRSMIFTAPNETCKCLKRVQRNPNFDRLYQTMISCLNGELESPDSSNAETKRLLEALARGCEINKVVEMQESNRITVEIGINDELTWDHSRVRIDDMQVILHGARTSNGVIKISIESSGLSQDRYRGETFDFYGDKWRRDFAYYSSESRGDAPSSSQQDVHDIDILDAANVYRSFRGVYRTSTLFTTWVIKVDPRRNPDLVLSGLHKIELKFSGSFVATEEYNEPDDAGSQEEELGSRSFCYDEKESCAVDRSGWFSII